MMKPPYPSERGLAHNTKNIASGKVSQGALILAYLEQGHTLTPLEALGRFNCFSLAQRVSELKRQGHPIIADMITVPSGKCVAEYRLEQAKSEGSS